jgi:hypothetical protein
MFHAWESFYFMVGSAAAGLIGLLFVVVTLTADLDRSRVLRNAGIYMTPIVLHFAIVFSNSAVAMAPGLPVPARAILFGLPALVGLGNAARACLGIRAAASGAEAPHWSDFWLYGAAPAGIYVCLLAAVAALWAQAGWAAYALAALQLLLLMIGIRNAWDLVIWLTPGRNLTASAVNAGASSGPQ